MREIQQSKRTMQSDGSHIVSPRGVYLFGKAAKIICLAIQINSASKFPIGRLHPLKFIFCTRFFPVPHIFGTCAKSEIGFSIVKTVAVNVIDHLPFFCPQDKAMHKDIFPIHPGSRVRPNCTPVFFYCDRPLESRNQGMVIIINNSVLMCAGFVFYRYLNHWLIPKPNRKARVSSSGQGDQSSKTGPPGWRPQCPLGKRGRVLG